LFRRKTEETGRFGDRKVELLKINSRAIGRADKEIDKGKSNKRSKKLFSKATKVLDKAEDSYNKTGGSEKGKKIFPPEMGFPKNHKTPKADGYEMAKHLRKKTK